MLMSSNGLFKVFIQARMSSQRLPGKVLMDFRGLPIIRHVVNAAGMDRCVVLTSIEPSDDPLAEYCDQNGVSYFRGSLNDVHDRFCKAATVFKCDHVMRISADSPLMPRALIDYMAALDLDGADLVTNVFPRTFPKGHSAEIISVKTLSAMRDMGLDDEDREHVTRYFYNNPDQFNIRNVTQDPAMNSLDLAVDTRGDYDRLIDFDAASIHYNPKNWKVTQC